MSEYLKTAGKRRYFAKQFKDSYKKNKKNDRQFEKAFQVFVDSLDKGNVSSDPIQIHTPKAKEGCKGFVIYKARMYSAGKCSYRVMFSIKNNSVFFLQLHNKSKNDEANHDEMPICKSMGLVKEKRCSEGFIMIDDPMVCARGMLNEKHRACSMAVWKGRGRKAPLIRCFAFPIGIAPRHLATRSDRPPRAAYTRPHPPESPVCSRSAGLSAPSVWTSGASWYPWSC